MKNKFHFASIAIAMVGLMSATPVIAHAKYPVSLNTVTLNRPATKDVGTYPMGPEADLYREHQPAGANWISQLDPNTQLPPTGPEADPYLEHFSR